MTVPAQGRGTLKRVLLVWPQIVAGTFWSFEHALNIVRKKANIPPLGLLTVASLLPDDIELRLVDIAVAALTDADLRWADAVFLSGMLVQKESMQQVIAQARRLGVPVVAGGPHASTSYQSLPGVDHFVIGEAEDTLAALVADWGRGSPRRCYARPVDEAELTELRDYFGEDADIAIASERPPLDTSLVPRFDLLQLDMYASMAVQFSRGCPVGCEFCDIWTRFGRRTRTRSSDAVLADMDALKALGWTGPVFIVDDNLIGNIARARQMLKELVAWQHENDHPFIFLTEATLVLAERPDLLELMREAGFDMVFIGIETPSQESLAETGKNVNRVDRIGEQVATIQAAGIQVSSGFIIGFDNDPLDIAPKMIAFVAELGIPLAMVGLLTALPATMLQQRLQREGRMREGSSGNNTHQFALNFDPITDEQHILDSYREVLEALYSPSMTEYFQRCALYRDRWQPNPWAVRHNERKEVIGALRSLWVIGRRPHGPRYFQFLASTLLHKPAFFPRAMRLGLQGHHLREVTRDAIESNKAPAAASPPLLRRRITRRVRAMMA